MKAAVLVSVTKPLQIINDIQVPELKEGQLLVKLLYSGLCHSQLMEVQGLRGEDKYLPHMLGHEGIALVEQIGPNVKKVGVGDKVVLGWIKGLGLDAGGTQYKSPIGNINAGGVTTFSDYAVVSENRTVKVPDHIDDKVAVLLGCALPTGAGIVLNQLKPKPASSVVVYGLGGIGLSALLALKYFAPHDVIAFDVEADKLLLAKEFGATHCYLANQQGIAEFKHDFPQGVDYAVEAAGQAYTIEIAFSLVKRGGGICIFASHPKNGDTIQIDPYELICGKQLQGSWGGASNPDKDIPILVDIINKYQLPVERMLSNEYSLEQINTALDDLAARKIVRALITFD